MTELLENILMEAMTNEFKFGFELEGFMRTDKSDKFYEKITSTFGNDGELHDDISLDASTSTNKNQKDKLKENEVIVYDMSASLTAEIKHIFADPHLQSRFTDMPFGNDIDTTEDEAFEEFIEQEGIKPIMVKSFEYSSPVLTFNPSSIQKITKFIDETLGIDKYFITNDSCGFHHHFSFEGMGAEDIAWLFSQIAIDDKAKKLLTQLSDKLNEYGNPKFNFITGFSTDNGLNELKGAIEDFDFKEIVRLLNTDHYQLLNNSQQHRTIEWRGPREFLDTNDMQLVKDFYKQMWEVVRMFRQKLDMKDINGMSKTNYMKGLSKINNGQLFKRYHSLKFPDNKLLDENTLGMMIEKVKETPDILYSLTKSPTVLNQVCYALFVKGCLRGTLANLSKRDNIGAIYDMAYTYIPYVMAFKASSDALYRTSPKTLKRLYNTKYGFDSDKSLSKGVAYILHNINLKTLDKVEQEYEIGAYDWAKMADFDVPEELAIKIMKDPNNLTKLLNTRTPNFGKIFNEKVIEHLPKDFAKEYQYRFYKSCILYPFLIKFIDKITPYMLVSIVARAEQVNKLDTISKALIGYGKATQEDIEAAKAYMTKFYEHNFDEDL